jgi:hypothetical protein
MGDKVPLITHFIFIIVPIILFNDTSRKTIGGYHTLVLIIEKIKVSIRGYIGFMIIMVLMTSCGEDLYDDELAAYVERFKNEAADREVAVDFDQHPIEVRLAFLPDDIALGRCMKDFSNSHKVIINSLFWDLNTELEKEKLIFHELGHCVLNRPHLDAKDLNGTCKSIMHSGQSCSDNYNETTRKAYLDELFN